MREIEDLPKEVRDDIASIKKILLDAGVTEIYLFGSYAEGGFRANSDLDIGVVGLEKASFFKIYGQILSTVSRNVDIIGLDYESEFSNEIWKQANLVKVA